MKPLVRVALGFTISSTFCLLALGLSKNYHGDVPEFLEPFALLLGVPALLFVAGLGLALLIKGGKEL